LAREKRGKVEKKERKRKEKRGKIAHMWTSMCRPRQRNNPSKKLYG